METVNSGHNEFYDAGPRPILGVRKKALGIITLTIIALSKDILLAFSINAFQNDTQHRIFA
jgi:hypothetical protein